MKADLIVVVGEVLNAYLNILCWYFCLFGNQKTFGRIIGVKKLLDIITNYDFVMLEKIKL